MKKFGIFLLALAALLSARPALSRETAFRDIPYRSEGNAYALERCKLDIILPEEEVSGLPVVVWMHGGGLTDGDKSSVPALLHGGKYIIVSVNYRLLSKGATIDQTIDDAAAAVAWTFRNIATYGGRTDEIFVSGHSAGGYLTNMIGLDKTWLAKYGIDADSIAGLIPFSGQVISHFAYRQTLGLGPLQPSIDKFAPLYYVRPDAPPIVIISGDREMELFGRYEETAYFWRMLKICGHKDVSMYELQGYNHGNMAEPACQILKDAIRRILASRKTP